MNNSSITFKSAIERTNPSSQKFENLTQPELFLIPNINRLRNRKKIQTIIRNSKANAHASNSINFISPLSKQFKSLSQMDKEIKISESRDFKRVAIPHAWFDPLGLHSVAQSLNRVNDNPNINGAFGGFARIADYVSPPPAPEEELPFDPDQFRNMNWFRTLFPGFVMDFDSPIFVNLKAFMNNSILQTVSYTAAFYYHLVTNTKASYAAYVTTVGAIYLFGSKLSSDLLVYFIPLHHVYFANKYIDDRIRDNPARVNPGGVEAAEPHGPNSFSVEDIGSALSVFALSMLLGEKTVTATNFFKGMSDWSRVKDNLNDIIKLVFKVIDSVINFVNMKCLGRSRLTSFLSNADVASELLQKRLDYIETAQWNNDFHPTAQNYSYVDNTVSVVRSMIVDTPRTRSNEGYLRLLNNDLKRLTDIKVHMLNKGTPTTFLRKEPATLFISGTAGCGKSNSAGSIAMLLASKLIKDSPHEFLDDTDPAKLIWMKTKGKYHDGLNNQHKIIINDDFLQEFDIAGDPDSDIMDVIRTINSVPYQANMADVESKGKVFVHPEIFIATSNENRIQTQSVKHPEAVARRFDYAVLSVPADSYCLLDSNGKPPSNPWDRVLDPTRLPVGLSGSTIFPPDMTYFIPIDLLTGSIISPIRYTFYDLVELLHFKSIQKTKWHQARIDDLDNIKEAFQERCSIKLTDNPTINIPPLSQEDPLVIGESTLLLEFLGNDKVDQLYSMVSGVDDDTNSLWRSSHIIKNFRENFLEDLKSGLVNDLSVDELYLCYYDLEISLVDFPDIKPTNSIWTKQNEVIKTLLLNSYGLKELVFRKVIDFYHDNKNNIDNFSMILVMASTAGLLQQFSGYITNLFKLPTKQPHSVNIGMPKTSMSQGFMHSTMTKPHGYDPNGNALANSKLSSNSYTVNVRSGADAPFQKWGIVTIFHTVKDVNYAIIPNHFLLRFKKAILEEPDRHNLEVIFSSFSGLKKFSMCLGDILLSSYTNHDSLKQDIAILRIPTAVQPHKSIMKYFVEQSYLDRQSSLHVRIDSFTGRHITHIGYGMMRTSTAVYSKEQGLDYVIQRSIEHTIPVGPGDCGSIVTVLSTGTNNNIFAGVHACGLDDHGWGAVITKELLYTLIEEFTGDRIPLPNSIGVSPLSKFKCIGVCPNPPASGSKHILVRSKMFGKFVDYPPLKRPSKLFGDVDHDPKISVYRKYCNNTILLEDKILDYVIYEKLDHIKRIYGFYQKPIWTFEEAVIGVLDEKEAGGLNMATSLGYPLCKDYPNKAVFFSNPPDFELDRVKELKKKTEITIKSMLAYKRPDWWFVDFLKAELLKISKVVDFDSRLISGAPIEMIIVARMLCGSFMSSMTKNRIKNNSGLGIDETSEEWELLFKHMTTFGPEIFAGDYTWFDGSHTYQLIMCVCKLINLWYDDSYSAARVTLFECIARSAHIIEGKVYLWEGAMPSGNPLTSVINTIINELLFRYAFVKLVKPFRKVVFDDHVVACFVGDDNMIGPSSYVSDLFNEVTISNFMPSMGYGYTNESKTISTLPLRPYNEVEFLKRKFRFEPLLGRHLAPLRMETLTEMIQWTNKTDPEFILGTKVQSVVRELALHGQGVFDSLVPLIINTYQECYGPSAQMPRSTYFTTVLEDFISEPSVNII